MNNDLKATSLQKQKVFAYIRKSSEDRKDGRKGNQPNSFSYQEKEVKRLAEKYNLDIIEYFQEDKSGVTAYERPVFNRMIENLEKRDDVKGIVVSEISRLGRNFGDGGRVLWLLQSGVLENVYTNDKYYTNTPSDQLMMAVVFAIAKYSSDETSYRSRQGVSNKVKTLKVPAYPAPWGYKSVGPKGQRRWEIVPSEAEKVRRVFELYSTGKYNLPRLLTQITSEGIINPKTKHPFVINTLLQCLNRLAYTGRFEFQGEIIEGSYEPIITDVLYYRVQEILKSKEHVKTKHMSHLYTGLIQCKLCGAVLTATTAKKVHLYYRCSKPLKNLEEHKGMPYLEERLVNKVLSEALIALKPDEELFESMKAHLESQDDFESKELDRTIGRVQNAIAVKTNERNGFLAAVGAQGVANRPDHKATAAQYDQEILAMQQRVEKLQEDKRNIRESLLLRISNLRTVGQRFKTASEFAQREIVKECCANLEYDGKKLTVYWSPGIRMLTEGEEKISMLLDKDSNLGPSA